MAFFEGIPYKGDVNLLFGGGGVSFTLWDKKIRQCHPSVVPSHLISKEVGHLRSYFALFPLKSF